MGIVLLILKVIGIILLTILILILLSICSMLFVPVKYELKGDYDDNIDFIASFSWFFKFINGSIIYANKQFSYILRFFGKTIFPVTKKEPKKSKNKNKKTNKVKTTKPADTIEQIDSNETSNATIRIDNEKESVKEPEIIEKTGKSEPSIEKLEVDKTKNSPKQDSFFDKIRFLFKKLFDSFVHIKYSLLKFYGKIKEVINNIEYYLEVLRSDNTRIVFEKVKRQIWKVYKNFKPKTFYLKLHLGFGDNPDIQGGLLAVHGMLYPFHQGRIELEPDFETEKKEAHLFMKGRMQSYIILKFFYLYYFDKNIKELKGLFENRGGV